MMRSQWACLALAAFGCGQGSSVPAGQSSGQADNDFADGSVDAPLKDPSAEAEATPEPDASACDRQLPTCPAMPPSYQRDVAPIIKGECAACHFAGSTIARGVYSTYAQLQAGRGSVLNEVFACKMPVAPVPPLSPDERTTLLTWIECGGPNN
jgi:hypothetical protein